MWGWEGAVLDGRSKVVVVAGGWGEGRVVIPTGWPEGGVVGKGLLFEGVVVFPFLSCGRAATRGWQCVSRFGALVGLGGAGCAVVVNRLLESGGEGSTVLDSSRFDGGVVVGGSRINKPLSSGRREQLDVCKEVARGGRCG